MKKPYNTLLYFCAFGLLLWALYLNFVALDKRETTPAVKQLTEQEVNRVDISGMQEQPGSSRN